MNKVFLEIVKNGLRRGLSLATAIVLAGTALGALVKQDDKNKKGIITNYSGNLLPTTPEELLALLMPTAKAEDNKDAIISEMQEDMKNSFGDVITSKEGLWNMYSFYMGTLDEEKLNETRTLLSVVALNGSLPGNKMFPSSKYVTRRDEFLGSKVAEVEGLIEDVKKSNTPEKKQQLMSKMATPDEGVDKDIDLLISIDLTSAGQIYLSFGDSIDNIPWMYYTVYGNDGRNIDYHYKGEEKGTLKFEAETNELDGTGLNLVLTLDEIESMMKLGKAEMRGLLGAENDRMQILTDNPEKGCTIIK